MPARVLSFSWSIEQLENSIAALDGVGWAINTVVAWSVDYVVDSSGMNPVIGGFM